MKIGEQIESLSTAGLLIIVTTLIHLKKPDDLMIPIKTHTTMVYMEAIKTLLDEMPTPRDGDEDFNKALVYLRSNLLMKKKRTHGNYTCLKNCR